MVIGAFRAACADQPRSLRSRRTIFVVNTNIWRHGRRNLERTSENPTISNSQTRYQNQQRSSSSSKGIQQPGTYIEQVSILVNMDVCQLPPQDTDFKVPGDVILNKPLKLHLK
ncbi:uncharacterized protein LOC124287215 [Haliotis rubra]|uniref:uncharacterized protein LOC124287215 n=1 Tax=Haliotis rubra TaxID=36100 RepID=UPI001EE59A0A|nr:uncharacterized protein LOC124287215 [Haliotis rubra]